MTHLAVPAPAALEPRRDTHPAPRAPAPPSIEEDANGISDHDRAMAAIGRHAAAHGSRGAMTDPAAIAVLRRELMATVAPGRFRAAWRRRLRALGRQGGQA